MKLEFDYNGVKHGKRAFYITALFVLFGIILIFINHGIIGSAILFFSALKLMEIL